MGPALPKLKTDIPRKALFPYGKHPVITEWPGVPVRFAAGQHQLDIFQIFRKAYSFKERFLSPCFLWFCKVQTRPVIAEMTGR